MHNFGEWLEHFAWVQKIGTTAWLYSSISVIHYFTLFVMVGCAVIVDLRMLSLAARRQPVVQFARQVFPWMWTAFGLAVFSGLLMFTTDAGDYLPDTVFRVKMSVILLAVISAIVIQRKVPEWGAQPKLPGAAKVAAVISIILWIGSILAGVEIAAISGLG
ncbi:MAG TPA: DUF6644 family protein [Candidatus Acidoferrales bacterium]|nr:DUF6644 family protein [Candidatus Acidoferrales bacterium]